MSRLPGRLAWLCFQKPVNLAMETSLENRILSGYFFRPSLGNHIWLWEAEDPFFVWGGNAGVFRSGK